MWDLLVFFVDFLVGFGDAVFDRLVEPLLDPSRNRAQHASDRDIEIGVTDLVRYCARRATESPPRDRQGCLL